jgi:hypothetical protein
MNKIKAPIDNKNILEDFTDVFHNGTYLERTSNGITYQIFILNDCLCEISYRFGQNWFMVRMIEGDPDNIRKCSAEIASIIKTMDEDENQSKVKFNPVLGVYEFYFVES